MQRDIRRASEAELHPSEQRGVHHAYIDREARIENTRAIPCRRHFVKVVDCRDLHPVHRQEA